MESLDWLFPIHIQQVVPAWHTPVKYTQAMMVMPGASTNIYMRNATCVIIRGYTGGAALSVADETKRSAASTPQPASGSRCRILRLPVLCSLQLAATLDLLFACRRQPPQCPEALLLGHLLRPHRHPRQPCCLYALHCLKWQRCHAPGTGYEICLPTTRERRCSPARLRPMPSSCSASANTILSMSTCCRPLVQMQVCRLLYKVEHQASSVNGSALTRGEGLAGGS
jgi:hypothetical protein